MSEKDCENLNIMLKCFKKGGDIDHIIPVSTAKKYEDVIKLNHYTNLQPLCSYVNRVIKRDRLDYCPHGIGTQLQSIE